MAFFILDSISIPAFREEGDSYSLGHWEQIQISIPAFREEGDWQALQPRFFLGYISIPAFREEGDCSSNSCPKH